MKLTLHAQLDFPDLLHVVQQQEAAGLTDTTYQAYYSGLTYTRRVLALGEELFIAHTTIDTERELLLLTDHPYAGMEMHFNLTGTAQSVLGGKPVGFAGAQHNQLFFAGFKGAIQYAPGTQYSCLEVDAWPLAALRDRLAYRPEALEAHIAQVEAGQTFALGAGRPFTPAQQQVVADLLHPAPTGPYRRMYLEARVWELYALQAEQFSGAPPAAFKINAAERDQLHYVRQVLAEALDNPPSLLALARLAGLNLDKLKRGFKAEFGTTVFGYLHQLRMGRARELVTTGTLPLADVSALVGYKNPQHFTAAFKKYYGYLPSTLRR